MRSDFEADVFKGAGDAAPAEDRGVVGEDEDFAERRDFVVGLGAQEVFANVLGVAGEGS